MQEHWISNTPSLDYSISPLTHGAAPTSCPARVPAASWRGFWRWPPAFWPQRFKERSGVFVLFRPLASASGILRVDSAVADCGLIGVQGRRHMQRSPQCLRIEFLQRDHADGLDARIRFAVGEELRYVSQLRAAKEGNTAMFFAGAEAAYEFAPAETEHVPFDRLREIRLPALNPFSHLSRHRVRWSS